MFDKKAWSKKYYKKNKKKLISYKRAWRKRNPDKVHAENMKRADKIKAWALEHIEEKKRYDEKRRNRLRFGGNYYIVLKRDNYKCFSCNTNKNLLVHHKDGNGRNSKNPNNNLENLLTVCQSCHQKVYH